MSTHGWCSLRLRFDDRELSLLRAAEQVRGAALAHKPRPDALRNALSLSRAGHKLTRARPGASITFEESEIQQLVEAVRFASTEVQWVSDQRNQSAEGTRRSAVLEGFPELSERGLWRSFAVCRELEAVAQRLQQALSA